MKLKIVFLKLVSIPRILCIFFLNVYRKFFSPLYGNVCRYFPSCSAYALEAVTLHGVIRGFWLSGKRIIRCNPLSKGGVDHVPNKEGLVFSGKKPEILILNHPIIDPNE